MSDGLLADIRGFLAFEAKHRNNEGTLRCDTLDPEKLLERLEKRLSLPKLEEHEFVLDVEDNEDNPGALRASLRAVNECDKNDCPCHANNYAEWGIVYGEIPVKVEFDFGRYNSWLGEYDDTHIKVSEKAPAPSPCKLGDLPKLDPSDLGPRIVPCTTEGT